jgi:hypothetical protein
MSLTTTDQAISTGTGTEMEPTTRASENFDVEFSRTESGDGRSLVAEENPEIVGRGPGAEEPLGEPATVDMFIPKVGAVATEYRDEGADQGRSRTQVVWGQGLRLR